MLPHLDGGDKLETSLSEQMRRIFKAQVIFLYGGKSSVVPETVGMTWPLALGWVNKNKSNREYIGGELKIVSMYNKTDE